MVVEERILDFLVRFIFRPYSFSGTPRLPPSNAIKVWRTFGLSAPLFINSGDFLQIEIYYNKKHLFLENLFSRTTAVDFWILDLDFWSSRSRFLSLDLWLSLDFWILISGSLWSRFDFQILSKYNS